MKKSMFLLLICGLFLSATSVSAKTRGIAITTKEGKKVGTYSNSYALVIGASSYHKGWPRLESIGAEVGKIESALKQHGFNVTKVMDPSGKKLARAFEDFIDEYGYDDNNRLLFYFAGHGFSMNDGEKGYLVPVDAPNPNKDKKNFIRKSLDMTQILAWSRQMTAKHALFLFDSCFSGTIFKTRALPGTPPHISAITAKPVRQYITAGSAGEEVPARSVFAPSFIRALRGDADLTGDGYITGTELGVFLREKVMHYDTGQTPQYGKIKDPNLDEGDFVFRVASASPKASPASQNSIKPKKKPVAPAKKPQKEATPAQPATPKYVKAPTGPAPKPGQNAVWSEPGTDMKFVWVPGGCYQMGSKEYDYQERPVHEVCVDGFWMGKFEVTQAQWQQVMGNNPSSFKNKNNPVEKVSWNDTQAFIAKLNAEGNGPFRLPTEAEWEYAARDQGKDQLYAGGTLGKVAWYGPTSNGKPHPVGKKAPNSLGLHDMTGNVWEWCQDVYDKNAYAKHARKNPVSTTGSNERVQRGGSWYIDYKEDMRNTLRDRYKPDGKLYDAGFRLVRVQEAQ